MCIRDRSLVDQNGEKILPHSFNRISNSCGDFIYFDISRGKEGFYFPSLKKEVLYDGVQVVFHDNASIRWVRNDFKYAKFGFINKEGKEITPIHFERVGHTQEGMVSVFKDGKMGFIDESGELKIPMKFEDDGNYKPKFENGVAYTYLNGKYGFINKKGETVAPFEFEAIAYFEEGVAIAYRNGKWEELIF